MRGLLKKLPLGRNAGNGNGKSPRPNDGGADDAADDGGGDGGDGGAAARSGPLNKTKESSGGMWRRERRRAASGDRAVSIPSTTFCSNVLLPLLNKLS
jgi:hypothetical protein